MYGEQGSNRAGAPGTGQLPQEAERAGSGSHVTINLKW